MSKRKKKAYEYMQDVKTIEIPWEVQRFFQGCPSHLEILGSQTTLGEDFGDIEEFRNMLEWLVDQFGGEIKWEKL